MPQNAFNYGILKDLAHRPWPMPGEPWIMTQTWHDLLFAHWPVDPATLRSKIPSGLELDLFNGRAWIGIVPFHMTNVAARGIPALPWISAFPELNVRTYVRLGDKPGVFFFSLDARNALAVAAARTLFHLPYYTADMTVDLSGNSVKYDSRRRRDDVAVLRGEYGPIGPVNPPRPPSLEYFLTERYCLYAVDSANRLHRLEIHHPPWPLQPARGVFTANGMADAAGVRLPGVEPILHFSKRQDMVAWAIHRV